MARKTAYFGCMLGLGLIFGYIEALIPFNFGIPGIKLGLSNIVTVYLLYKDGIVSAFVVNTARIALSGILFGNAVGIFYSLCGGILALAVMAVVKKIKFFSTVGVSVAGAVFHNIGQLIAASIMLGTKVVIYYLPFLNVSGVITGFIIGIAATYLIRRVKF